MAGEVERLQELVDKYDNIVFFGGAGVSTESGIPDFRSQDGLYHQKYDYPPETILSHCAYSKEKPSEIRTVFCCLDLLFFVEQCFVDIIAFCCTVL